MNSSRAARGELRTFFLFFLDYVSYTTRTVGSNYTSVRNRFTATHMLTDYFFYVRLWPPVKQFTKHPSNVHDPWRFS
jgi:hypothetical protein